MSEEKLSVRLEAFLAAREGMRGVDPEEVFRANGVELTMTDLREATQLARRVEEAPYFTVERVVTAGMTWNGVDVTDFAEYGQRVRLVRDA